MRVVFSMVARTSSGSRDTEQKALTVIPCNCSPTIVVRTVTPLGKWPMTERNRAWSGAAIDQLKLMRMAQPPHALLALFTRSSQVAGTLSSSNDHQGE